MELGRGGTSGCSGEGHWGWRRRILGSRKDSGVGAGGHCIWSEEGHRGWSKEGLWGVGNMDWSRGTLALQRRASHCLGSLLWGRRAAHGWDPQLGLCGVLQGCAPVCAAGGERGAAAVVRLREECGVEEIEPRGKNTVISCKNYTAARCDLLQLFRWAALGCN